MKRLVSGGRVTRRRDVLEMILLRQCESVPSVWFELKDDVFISVVNGRFLLAFPAPEPPPQPWYQRAYSYMKGLFQ